MTFPHKILRELKPNWNSYGAPVIDTRCIEKAFELWRHLPPGDWQVVPCVDGGVQIEQHRDGFDIEITVSPASAQETPAVPCAKCAGTRVVYGHNYNGDQYQVPCPDCSTANREVTP